MGWTEDRWDAEVWNGEGQGATMRMTRDQRELLWEGEKAFQRCDKAFRRAGFDAQRAQQEPYDP